MNNELEVSSVDVEIITIPTELEKMASHTECLIHLNEILECALSKLKGSSDTVGSSVIQPEPNGLIDVMSNRNKNISSQLEQARDYAIRISDLL